MGKNTANSIKGKTDNYLTTGLNNVTIGTASGALGTGTACFNDFLTNGGANIAGGSGVSQRSGNKLFFTNLRCKLYANLGATGRFRVIVGKSPDATMATKQTNTAATALVEGTAVLEPPLAGTVLGVVDYPLAPSTDFKILMDTMYCNPTGASSGIPVEFTVPLNLERCYDNTGVVTRGSWFIYIATTANTSFYGYIKCEYDDKR